MKGWMSRFKAIFALSLLALLLSGCGEPFLSALQPQGEVAEKIFYLMILSVAIMVFVFLVVMVIYTYVIIKYRRKKGHEDYIPKQVEGNHALETIWTVIPIILLLILAIPTVQYTFSLVDTSKAEVTDEGEVLEPIWINVTGKQYWWHFEYEGLDITTSQEMYIPTDRKVYLSLISEDVIHSFWVPPLAGKMDVNPTGNRNEMYLNAYEEGVYWGKCAELCGPSHSLMDFKVIAVSPGEFEQWVLEMQQVDPEAVPESVTAQEGQELFATNCLACHAIGSSQNKMGPNLTNFADRTTVAGVFDFDEKELKRWIETKGKDMKPGNLMVSAPYDLTEDEIDKIVEYLLTLSPSEITPESAEDGVYIESDLSALFGDDEEETEEDENNEDNDA